MKGFFSGRTYMSVSVDIKFDDVWDDLSSQEQHDIVLSNTDLLTDAELVSELESRGYTCNNKE